MFQPTYANLEIRILKQEADGYPIELTLNGEQQFERGYLDPAFLPWIATADPAADGERLFNWLLANEQVKRGWAMICGQHQQRRIRLRIDTSAPELHAMPWELLRDSSSALPQDLAAATATPFSRYWAGEWQPEQPIRQHALRGLVAIANPANLTTAYNLPAIEVEAEWQALRQSTSEQPGLEWVLLPQPCTLAAIESELQKGYQVLHLISHGRYRNATGQAVLYLANHANQVELATDQQFAQMLARQLANTDSENVAKVRLVFLAACQSAQQSPADAFRGFAPLLVQVGLAAVLAMQDRVPVATARHFAGVFYRQLLQHGLVDLAANVARSALLTARLPGAAIPILYTRLRNGILVEPPITPPPPVRPYDFEPETVLIPAGTFGMGCDDGAAHERPRHEVTLPAYAISQQPITNAQYAAFVQQNSAYRPRGGGWRFTTPPADKLHEPVTGLSWHDALAYSNWLSEQSGRPYRLPSEAEWEKAAQADTIVSAIREWTSTIWGDDASAATFAYPYWADGRDNLTLSTVYRIWRRRTSQSALPGRGFASPTSRLNDLGLRVVLVLEAQ